MRTRDPVCSTQQELEILGSEVADEAVVGVYDRLGQVAFFLLESDNIYGDLKYARLDCN